MLDNNDFVNYSMFRSSEDAVMNQSSNLIIIAKHFKKNSKLQYQEQFALDEFEQPWHEKVL